MKKRVIALILVVLVLMSVPGNIFAGSINADTNVSSLELEAVRLQRILPEDASVTISNGELHIYVENIYDFYEAVGIEIPENSTMTTSVYAPRGGSYRNFGAPSIIGVDYPYSQVFMPNDIARSVRLFLSRRGIVEDIVDYFAENVPIDDIVAYVRVAYGVDVSWLTRDTLIFMADLVSFFVTLEYSTLNRVIGGENGTNKVLLTRMSSPTVGIYNVYSVWSSNTCATMDGISATWYGGVYDIED